jgi:hypothetical protein
LTAGKPAKHQLLRRVWLSSALQKVSTIPATCMSCPMVMFSLLKQILRRAKLAVLKGLS